MLLGLNGTVVIAHGSSTRKGVAAACVLASTLARQGTVGHVGERIAATHRSHRLW